MALVSMVRDQQNDMKAQEVATPMLSEKYPWELRITLNKEQLDKLGIDIKTYTAGESIKLSAQANITEIRNIARESTEENTIGDQNNDQSISLQITDLALVSNDDFDGAFKDALEEE